jgi:hypothetical protein
MRRGGRAPRPGSPSSAPGRAGDAGRYARGVSTRMTLCAIFPYAAAIVAFALGS